MKQMREALHMPKITRKLLTRILLIQLAALALISGVSYLALRPPLRNQAIRVAADMNAQMASQLSTLFDSIGFLSQYVLTSGELQSTLSTHALTGAEQSYMETCLHLNRLMACDPSIRALFIDDGQGTTFDSISTSGFSLGAIPAAEYAAISGMEYGDGAMWIQGGGAQDSLVFMENRYIGKENYTITLVYDLTNTLTTLRDLSAHVFERFYVLDDRGLLLYTSDGSALGDEIVADCLSGRTEAHEDQDGIYFFHMLRSNLWHVVSFASEQSLGQTYTQQLGMTFAFFVLMFALTTLLITPAITAIIRPLGDLASSMRSVSDGKMHSVPAIESDDEIGELSQVFQEMMDSINRYIEQIIDQEQTQQKMKYSLLISQIDPHFIYNTMSILNMLAKSGRTGEIIAINSALIKILKDRLRVRQIEIYDTVRQEVSIVEQYLLIQKYRYEYDVDFVWDVDENVWDREIPKNIIQPLIENSLFHGLICEETGEIRGQIIVTIRDEDGGMLLTVKDNGRGFDLGHTRSLIVSQTRDDDKRGRHIGLQNLRDRLIYLYGDTDCMEIKNDGGAVVILHLRATGGDRMP